MLQQDSHTSKVIKLHAATAPRAGLSVHVSTRFVVEEFVAGRIVKRSRRPGGRRLDGSVPSFALRQEGRSQPHCE